jgi:predicted dehydrogenase
MRLAVVGAGIMGANHARLSQNVRDIDLVWVVDPDAARAATLADAFGAKAASSLDEVLDDVDAAVVASPTDDHGASAATLLRAGKHVLVEKPLAATAPDARTLVGEAERAGTVLMVGHVERFNPAVLALDPLLDDVVHIAAQRISPYSSRVRDDVVLDLMIHDLDIVSTLAGVPVRSVRAAGRAVRSGRLDVVSALLTFENDIVATLTASRVGQQKIRTLEITQTDGFVSVDLVRQDVTINRVEHSEFLSSEGARYRQTGVVEIPFLEHRGEPLELELREFAAAIAGDRAPRVTGKDGVIALELVEAVRRAVEDT